MKDIRLIGTTDASGDMTVMAESTAHGQLYKIEWMGSNFAEDAEVTLSATDACSGNVCRLLILESGANTDTQYYPRTKICEVDGADLESSYIEIYFAGTPQLAVSGGGANKEGGCILHYED